MKVYGVKKELVSRLRRRKNQGEDERKNSSKIMKNYPEDKKEIDCLLFKTSYHLKVIMKSLTILH